MDYHVRYDPTKPDNYAYSIWNTETNTAVFQSLSKSMAEESFNKLNNVIDIDALLRQAVERMKSMSPEEKDELKRQQMRSYVIAEAGFGSDSDEAEMREAIKNRDENRIAQLNADVKRREKDAARRFDEMEKRR